MAPDVSFLGLGAMGFGMATNLVHRGFHVTGFDVWPPTLQRFAADGGALAATAPTAAAAVAAASVCVVMVATAVQAQALLVGADGRPGAAAALPHGAAILLCSTVSSTYVQGLARTLAAPDGPVRRPDLQLLDAPVSGGAQRAAEGSLTIMVGAAPDALAHARARAVLAAMADPARLLFVAGGLGAGSHMKMVHQVLATNQVLAAAEAVGLLARLRGRPLDATALAALLDGPGASWMLGHRGARMQTAFAPVASALVIITKDVAIITSEARRTGFAALLTTVTENSLLDAVARGWGPEDDSALLKLYEAAPVPGAAAPEAALAAAAAVDHTHRDALSLTAALLQGIHLVAAAESLAFAHHVGLDLDQVLAMCLDAAGGSAILAAHGPALVAALRTGTVPATAPADPTLSLGAVFQGLSAAIAAAQQLKMPVYLGTQALNILTLALRQTTDTAAASNIVTVWLR